MSGGVKGAVYLVGAGPGSLDLVTLRAWELIPQADVLVYDYLCNPALLARAQVGAEIVYAGKSASAHTLTQDEINGLLLDRAQAGKVVVRLKGGDPYVFGRGGEEAQVLARAGIRFEVVPGVTSAVAAPAFAGIPVTHRDCASAVTFVTGHEDPTKAESSIDWKHLAGLRGTKVFLMGVERLREITARLISEGADPVTPTALVRWGTTGRQQSLRGTLATIADLVRDQKFAPPALTIIGDVVSLRDELNWFEKLPLFGQRIVVTRTRAQASSLARHLMHLGADVLEIPTIRIVPVALRQEARTRLAALGDHADWVILTSPNAANLFLDEFRRTGADVRSLGQVRFAALGPATAAPLKKLMLNVDLQPGIYTNEKLTEAFAQVDIAGKRFCLPHGNLADSSLPRFLREHGGMVDEWILYETRPEHEDWNGARARYAREGAHWITFTSSSTVENWDALKLTLSEDAARPRALSLGPVTTATLRRLGYDVAAEAPEATIDSLIAALLKLV